MRFQYRTKITIAVTTLCLAVGFVLNQFVIAQAPAPQGGRGTMTGQQRGGGMMGADPRAKTLTYHFKEADEDMQYCLFISSKVSKDKKSPLIVTLHGMGAGPTIMVSKAAVDLAEEGGYILVSPMGYNTTGWYGSMTRRHERHEGFCRWTQRRRTQRGRHAWRWRQCRTYRHQRENR